MTRRSKVAVAILSMTVGCAHAPSAFSSRSAASLDAPSAPLAVLGRSLSEEPPLPGASTEGWTGLGAPPTADPHAGHHMHHGHHDGASTPPPAPPAPAPAEETHDHAH